MTTDAATDLSMFTGPWALDPERTRIEFRTRLLWVVKVKGTFQALEGRASVSPDGAITGSVVVDMASVNTKSSKRDHHLRGPEFLDTEAYPVMTFTATSGRLTTAGQVEIGGDLTIHGETRPLAMLADVTQSVASLTLSCEVHIDRSDWGISLTKGPGAKSSLRNHVLLTAHFDRD